MGNFIYRLILLFGQLFRRCSLQAVVASIANLYRWKILCTNGGDCVKCRPAIYSAGFVLLLLLLFSGCNANRQTVTTNETLATEASAPAFEKTPAASSDEMEDESSEAGKLPANDASGEATGAATVPASRASSDVEAEMRLAVVGDIMLARGVGSTIAAHGVNYPFAAVAERLRLADYTFANLEAPFGTRGHPIPGKQIWFRADPASLSGMVNAGIDGVTLANNHILDYDTENFLETLDLLEEYGIDYVGGGRDLKEARNPLIVSVNGMTIAFLAYSEFADIFWDWNYPRSFAATPEIPGVAPIREETLGEDIERARALADLVIVAYHWGDENVNVPNAEQVRLGRKTIDLGAGIVLGFHPHALQGIEAYNGGLIAYSLGNFVMDQKKAIQRESMILELTLTPQGVMEYEVIPVMIENNQPRILDGEQADWLLAKIEQISKQIPGDAKEIASQID